VFINFFVSIYGTIHHQKPVSKPVGESYQSNLAKDDIVWLTITCGTAHSCLVDSFYHIPRVAARFAKLVMRVHLGPLLWGEGGVGGSAMAYYLKERL